MVFYQNCGLWLTGASAPVFQFQLFNYYKDLISVRWLRSDGIPLQLPRRRSYRSLTSLWLEDSAEKIQCKAVPLDRGCGAAFSLAGHLKARRGFSLTAAPRDSVFHTPPKRIDRKTWLFQNGGSVTAVTSTVRIDSVTRVANGAQTEWRFWLAASRKPRVVLCSYHSPQEAPGLSKAYVRKSPRRLEKIALEELRSNAAFQLQTEDDATNAVYALLASSLVKASPRVPLGTRSQIVDAAVSANGLWLASRERPAIVFPDTAIPPLPKFTTDQAREYLRWGGPAYRAALMYGMADENSLRALSLEVLEGLSRLQREYVSGDVDVLADKTNADELMRSAVAHVQLADLMTLGEEISAARNEAESQRGFRREALRARRQAGRLFSESAKLNRALPENKKRKLVHVLDTLNWQDSAAEEIDPLRYEGWTYPDTGLFMSAGAKYGFNWLDDRPELIWKPRYCATTFDGLRWTAHRFQSDVTLRQTADFDSLISGVINGPIPGQLTVKQNVRGEPSIPAMAAAFQNLAEVYAGIRCDALRSYVTIEPRLPENWGHTFVRVPYCGGFLHVEYDFSNEQAILNLTGDAPPVAVMFGYPLENAGFLRVQLNLQSGETPKRVFIEHRAENRMDLKVVECE